MQRYYLSLFLNCFTLTLGDGAKKVAHALGRYFINVSDSFCVNGECFITILFSILVWHNRFFLFRVHCLFPIKKGKSFVEIYFRHLTLFNGFNQRQTQDFKLRRGQNISKKKKTKL